MGFLKGLFGGTPQPWPPPGPITTWPVRNDFQFQGDAEVFDRDPERYVDVVGESHHQDLLDEVAGGKTPDGARVRDHTALLLPQPTNQYDPNAVRVFVIPAQGRKAVLAGYLSREDAITYRPVIDRVAAGGRVTMCNASLKGGWDSDISFGVILWIGPPWALMAELDRNFGLDPRWPPQFTAFGDDGKPYDRTNCPSCGEVLDPLPKAKKSCPSCGQSIFVRVGPDGVRHLLREADLAALETQWEEARDQ